MNRSKFVNMNSIPNCFPFQLSLVSKFIVIKHYTYPVETSITTNTVVTNIPHPFPILYTPFSNTI